jgi:hypothetical protein
MRIFSSAHFVFGSISLHVHPDILLGTICTMLYFFTRRFKYSTQHTGKICFISLHADPNILLSTPFYHVPILHTLIQIFSSAHRFIMFQFFLRCSKYSPQHTVSSCSSPSYVHPNILLSTPFHLAPVLHTFIQIFSSAH